MDLEAHSGYEGDQSGFGEYCTPCLHFRGCMNEFTRGRKFDNPAFMHQHAMMHASLAEAKKNGDLSLKSCFPNTFINTLNHHSCPPNSFNSLQIDDNPCSGFQTGVVTSNPFTTKDFGNKPSSGFELVDVNDRYSTQSAYRLNGPNSFENFHTRSADHSDEFQNNTTASIPFQTNGFGNKPKQTGVLHSVTMDVDDTKNLVHDVSSSPLPLRDLSKSTANEISNNNSINNGNDNISSILSRETGQRPTSDSGARNCSQPVSTHSTVSTEKSSRSNLVSNFAATTTETQLPEISSFGGQIRKKRNIETVDLDDEDDNSTEPELQTIPIIDKEVTQRTVIKKVALGLTTVDKTQTPNVDRHRQPQILDPDFSTKTKASEKIKNGDKIKCRSCGLSYQPKGSYGVDQYLAIFGEYCAPCVHIQELTGKYPAERKFDTPALKPQPAKILASLAEVNDNIDNVNSLESSFMDSFTVTDTTDDQSCPPYDFGDFHARTVNPSDEFQNNAAGSSPILTNSVGNKQTILLHSAGADDDTINNIVHDVSKNRLTDFSATVEMSMHYSINNDTISSSLSGATGSRSSSNHGGGNRMAPVSILSTEKVSRSNLTSNLADFSTAHPSHPTSWSDTISNDYKSGILPGTDMTEDVRIKRSIETVKLEDDDDETEPQKTLRQERRQNHRSANDKSTLDLTSAEKNQTPSKRGSTKILDKAVSTKLIAKFDNGGKITCRSCGWSFEVKAIIPHNMRALCNHIFNHHVHGKTRRYKCLTCDVYLSFNTNIKHRSHSVLDLAVIFREKISEFVDSNFVHSSNGDDKPSPHLRLPNIDEEIQNEDITGSTGNINEKVRVGLGLTLAEKNQKQPKLRSSTTLETTVATKLYEIVKKEDNIKCRSCGWRYRAKGRSLHNFVTGITRHIFMVHVQGQKRRYKCLTCNAYLNSEGQRAGHSNHSLLDLAKIHSNQISLFVENNFIESSNDGDTPSSDLILPDVKDHLKNQKNGSVTENTERQELISADRIRIPKLRSTRILDPEISTTLSEKVKNGDKIKCRSCGWSYQAKGSAGMNNYLKAVCNHIFMVHVHGKKRRYKCLTCDLYFSTTINHRSHSVLDLAVIFREKFSEFVESNFVHSSNGDDKPSPNLILSDID